MRSYKKIYKINITHFGNANIKRENSFIPAVDAYNASIEPAEE